MQCDLCSEYPAAVLISNTGNGDTQAVCGQCLPGWCLAMVAADFQASGMAPEDMATEVISTLAAITQTAGGDAGGPTPGETVDASPTGGGTGDGDPGPAGALPEQTDDVDGAVTSVAPPGFNFSRSE